MTAALVKKHLTNVVLCALALVAVVWTIADSGSVTTSESERRKQNLFPAWRHDDVTRVVAEQPTERYELARKEGPNGRTWDLVQDGTIYAADEQVVDRLLGTFEYATFSREVPPGSVDRAAMGLDAPAARYEIGMGSLSFKLSVGKANPGGDGVYVEIPDRGVYLVAASLVRSLAVPSKELRGRDFVPYLSTDLAEISIEGEGGKKTFVRAPWGGGRGSGFRFPSDAEGRGGRRVDGTRLDQVLVAFGRMQAQTFLDPEQAKAASKPRVTITLVPKEGPRGALVLGGDCPEKKGLIVAIRTAPSPLAVCLPEGVLAPLVRPIEEFDDNGLLGATADEISELKIERDAKVLEIVRTGAAFQMRRPEAREVDLDMGNAFLESLTSAQGTFAKDDPAFAEGERTRVRVVSVGGMPGPDGNVPERVEELEIGPGEGGTFIAVRKEDGVKLVVGQVSAQAFRPDDLALRDTQIFSMSADVIEGMTIERGGQKQRFDRDGGSFVLVEPQIKNLQADLTFAQEAVMAFSKLKAERWVARTADPAMGLSEPRLVVTAHLAEGASKDPAARTVTIRVGARTDDGSYAQIEGEEPVFILPRRFESIVSKSFVSRKEFDVPPELIERVVIKHGDKKLTMVRDGKQLRLEGGGGSGRESELVDALAALTPHVAVALGAPAPAHGLEPPAISLSIVLRKFPDDPPDSESRVLLTIGSADLWDGIPIYFARRDGVDAVYAIPQKPVRAILAAMGE